MRGSDLAGTKRAFEIDLGSRRAANHPEEGRPLVLGKYPAGRTRPGREIGHRLLQPSYLRPASGKMGSNDFFVGFSCGLFCHGAVCSMLGHTILLSI